ncbi:MAG TPA: hypothetical protein VFY39_12900 [Gammaproteobacteria bacterium]|nr:hypothetical protein [Gammaproteobacteria bacterium]
MAKPRRGKLFGAVIGLVVLALILTFVGLYVTGRFTPTIIAAIESYGEQATGTNVQLQDADISLTQSQGTLSGLTIASPQGFGARPALAVDKILVDLDLGSLVGRVATVNDVSITGATLNVEQMGTRNNLKELLDHLEQQDTGAAPKSSEPEQRVIIDHFKLSGGKITLTSDLFKGEQMIDLPDVVVNDVGRAAGGIGFSEAASQLLTPILQAAQTAVEQKLKNAATESAKEKAEESAKKKLQDQLK